MINTLTLARELTESGIKREQAEAIADVVAKAVTHQNGSLATTEFVRTHVGELQKGMDGKIDSIRVEIGELRVEISKVRVEISALDAKVSATEVRIVRWLIGIGIALGLFQVFGDRILGI